jgi:hypothetical protein
MKIIISIFFFLFFFHSFSQTFTEDDIKELAGTVNQKLKGIDIGNGIKARGCIAIGRTLIYQYDVPKNWEASENAKEDLIANFKTIGSAKIFFLNKVNVDFYYFKYNKIVKKIGINSNEFSTYNFKLGDYLSIKDHKKSKDINLKLKVPQGWEVKEGDRPNIVKKFTKNGNIYLILTKDNMNFFSRSESEELLSDDSFVNEFVEEASSFLKNAEVIDKSIVTIDTYPSVTFKVRGKMERSGITIPMIMRCWAVFYEDKMVFLQSMGIDNAEFKALEQLYFLVTNSVIFPDQYN